MQELPVSDVADQIPNLHWNLNSFKDPQNRTFEDIESFVNAFCEDPTKARCIKKVLVATNGIAAVKCILSLRGRLMQLFKNDKIIKFICLTTEQEIKSKAEYLKMADNIVISPAGANTNNYANVDEIIKHAVSCKADAVFAGWGHASENPKLPEELNKRGIVFIGPPASAMFALGDKIASTIIAQSVNIPTIEWSGSGIQAPSSFSINDVTIPEETYREACVSTAEEGLRCMQEKNISYPVMIKASEGGGGKGIRKCVSESEFAVNFRRVQAEVPGSPIFLMKCMINARHIEVQLIADQYGQVIPIFTRDCSIQRRCQKIIEEAPAGIAPPEVLRNMQRDAVNLAKKVGYVSAGTVEYMYLPETQQYYFLELNPRLQVEHPCTEMIADLNIPAVQLQVAMGIPLHRIVEIRTFFKMDRYGDSPLPEDQIRTDTKICVVAARITSEDPAEGFRPASGSLSVLNFQSNQNVWGYFSVSSSGKVHEFADSQFGHLFAKGATRHEAVSALMCALNELELRATFQSQISYLGGILRDPDFENNTFHTGWLDARIAAKVQSGPEHPLHVTIAIGATVIAHARMTEVFEKFKSAIKRGQVLPTSELTETCQLELVHKNIKYSVLVNRDGPSSFLVCINNVVTHTRVHQYDVGGGILVTYADQSFQCHLDEEQERFKVTIGYTMTIFEKENDPSVLRSRNAGKLLQYLKKDGEKVENGDVYAEMESMKMVINLDIKKGGGVLVQRARPGQVLFPGTLIAELTDQGDMAALRPVNFDGCFDEWVAAEQALASPVRLDSRFENSINACNDILAGYAVPEHMFGKYVSNMADELFAMLNDKQLPFTLYKVVFNVVKSRIKKADILNRIAHLLDQEGDFCAAELSETMNSYLDSLNPADVGMEKSYFGRLQLICDRFAEGNEGHKRIIVKELIDNFLGTEKYFQDVSYDKGVSEISSLKERDIDDKVRMVYSHTKINVKNALLQEIISRLDDESIEVLQPVLKVIASLFNAENETLAVFVRKILMRVEHGFYGQLCSNLSRKSSRKNLKELVTDCSELGGDTVLQNLVVDGAAELKALLHEFFFTANPATNTLAVKHFIKSAFHIDENEVEILPNNMHDATFFKFQVRPMTPLYQTNDSDGPNVVYLLSVLNKLDLLKKKDLMTFLKGHAKADAHNVFLFVAFPTGENGYSHAMHKSEAELRKLGFELKEEVEGYLQRHNIPVGGVDLMISLPSNPPIYAQHDFSAKMKLELNRLPAKIKDVSTPNSSYLLFQWEDQGIQRLFVRHLMRDIGATVRIDKYSNATPIEKFRTKLMDVIDGACGEIRVHSHCSGKEKIKSAFDCNHMLIRIDYDPKLNTDGWSSTIKQALCFYEKSFIKLRVTEVEIVYQANEQNNVVAYRAIYTNETGAIPEFAIYRVANGLLQVVGDGPCKYNNQKIGVHLPIAHVKIQERRMKAHKLSTTYCYDLPIVFGRAVLDLWQEYRKTNPKSFDVTFNKLPQEQKDAMVSQNSAKFCRSSELILKDENGPVTVIDDELELRERAESTAHDRGMVAWILKLFGPDCPQGREIVLIANDITYQMGSFSMKEHLLYYHASLFSRKHKLPRVYVAANSGARIGFAQDIKKNFKVLWNNPDHPEDGFESLYLEEAASSNPDIRKQVDGTSRDGKLLINHVIGREDDIGVENLVGSGLIAGETSAAYLEVPIYCLVTGRAVGIGAYAARLSHRVVQVEPSSLILTGAPALNSLLGREIYTSNGQLGGTQIMHRNGVSHAVAQSDLEGITKIARWMSYLPQAAPENPLDAHILSPLTTDDLERRVTASPPKGQYDPRTILDPKEGGGLFDANSLDEIMDGWAKTIICGRARLCGIPVGVVAVETRTMQFEIPADPAAENSQSSTVSQAGQVWYPDSAYKTAEAINDFNKEGLPLVFLANIRGFSGGQKDMFEMVLKFGAKIVDALQAYKQPVIVYIPPNGELRGGAWAVLDTHINPTCMKMLADVDSRGGVLEPDGIVEIKFRKDDLHSLMLKCDPHIQNLTTRKLAAVSQAEVNEIETAIKKRREFLFPVYRTVSVKFADLHDTPIRMLAKGAIHDQLNWCDARNYIHQLLQVQLIRLDMARRYAVAMGVHTPLSIQDLDDGCKWVNQYLLESKCSYMTQSEQQSGKSRFSYNVAEIRDKSHGFSQVLEKIIVEKAASSFIAQWKSIGSSGLSSILSQLVQTADEETRQDILDAVLSIAPPAQR